MIRFGSTVTATYTPKRFVSNTTRIIHKQSLPATAYKPEIVEKGKYEKWEKIKIFYADTGSDKPSYSLVLPPPNVTGKLHLGHALSCTIQDVIARRKRSLGLNVLWVPGTDHAGIATQSVVEKYLKTTQNINRQDIGREKFNSEVWKWRERHGKTICHQLKLLGNSLDWSRELFTMDKNHTYAVNIAFINLFRKGLIYRRKAIVNWCNKLNSTVSDIEILNITLDGPTDMLVPGYEKPVKFGLIYNFAYKIFDSNEEIVVSTTMPETMLGDTAVAVHPGDNRYKHLIGKKAIHPFRNTRLPIIADDIVDMNFGTGAVKITPAHSKVDNEVAKHHHLTVLQVVNERGLIQNAGKYNNMKKYDCRETVVQDLDDLGLLRSVKSHQMTLPTCSRTGDIIEYLPKEQWFLSCSELNERATQVVKDKELKIEPEKFTNNWLSWTSDDRDWCISRQLWWGHQVPAYKCSIHNNVVWIAAMDEESAKVQASKYLRALPDEIVTERDTDVLDTWFSSGIYPFACLGWPEHNYNDNYSKFYPLSLMVTGHDILGFWVHRMVILSLELTSQLPFHNVLLHGIICDSKGAKMSKSRGNVIDPIDVINGISLVNLKHKVLEMHKDGIISKDEMNRAISYHKSNFSTSNGIPECGVDALRFTLLSQDIKSHFVNFDVYQCHANKLFCNKIWQSVKYMQLSYAKLKNYDGDITINDLTHFDRWILSRLSNMVEKVNTTMESYDFHLTTKSLRSLIYNEFCDVYLEATKPGFHHDNIKVGYAHAHTLSVVLNTSLRCLAPFMVYLTDEVIPKIPGFETNIIHNFDDIGKDYYDLPNTEDFRVWKNDELEKKINKVLNTIHLVREIKGLYNISNKYKPLVYVKTKDVLLAKDLEEYKEIVINLSRSEDVIFHEEPNKKFVSAVLDEDTEVNVEVVSEDVENTILSARDKLQKKIRKLEETLTKLENKISNTQYIKSVPEWTQVLEKERLLMKKEELKKLQRLI